MRHLLFGLAAIFVNVAQGKSVLGSWDSLRQIAPGSAIRATTAEGHAFLGQFQSASNDSLAMETAKEQQSLDRIHIVRVQLRRAGHRLKHGLIGLGVRAGAGLAVGAVLDQHTTCGGFCIDWAPLGKIVMSTSGAIIGGATGALMPSGGWKDLYRAP